MKKDENRIVVSLQKKRCDKVTLKHTRFSNGHHATAAQMNYFFLNFSVDAQCFSSLTPYPTGYVLRNEVKNLIPALY
jgi:hypothetical protein